MKKFYLVKEGFNSNICWIAAGTVLECENNVWKISNTDKIIFFDITSLRKMLELTIEEEEKSDAYQDFIKMINECYRIEYVETEIVPASLQNTIPAPSYIIGSQKVYVPQVVIKEGVSSKVFRKIYTHIYETYINKPEVKNFLEGVKLENEHQSGKWGKELNAPPHHYSLVFDLLKGKLSEAILKKDKEKFAHHLITIAAAGSKYHELLNNPESEVWKWFNTTS
jgi:hypothetical protein